MVQYVILQRSGGATGEALAEIAGDRLPGTCYEGFSLGTVTFWTHEDVVRRIAMADTFTKDGISRSITLLDGEPLPAESVEWIRVK